MEASINKQSIKLEISNNKADIRRSIELLELLEESAEAYAITTDLPAKARPAEIWHESDSDRSLWFKSMTQMMYDRYQAVHSESARDRTFPKKGKKREEPRKSEEPSKNSNPKKGSSLHSNSHT